jgi:hypothetical protein
LFPSSETIELTGKRSEQTHEVLQEDFMRLLAVIGVKNNKFGITQFEQFFEIRNTETRETILVRHVNNVASWLLDFFTETPQTYSVLTESGRGVTKHEIRFPKRCGELFCLGFQEDVVSVRGTDIEHRYRSRRLLSTTFTKETL